MYNRGMVTLDKPKVYIESSTISYLMARPTEEPIRKEKQILIRQWWERREKSDMVTIHAFVLFWAGGNFFVVIYPKRREIGLFINRINLWYSS